MTHKERVLRAFAFEEADRVPLDIGGLNVTSMHLNVQPRLFKTLSLAAAPPVTGSVNMQSALVDERCYSILMRMFDACTPATVISGGRLATG